MMLAGWQGRDGVRVVVRRQEAGRVAGRVVLAGWQGRDVVSTQCQHKHNRCVLSNLSEHIPLYERAGQRGGDQGRNVQPNTALLLWSTSPVQQLQTHESAWVTQLKNMCSTYSVSLGAEKIEVWARTIPVCVPLWMHCGRGNLGQDLASSTLLTLRVRAGHECAT